MLSGKDPKKCRIILSLTTSKTGLLPVNMLLERNSKYYQISDYKTYCFLSLRNCKKKVQKKRIGSVAFHQYNNRLLCFLQLVKHYWNTVHIHHIRQISTLRFLPISIFIKFF